MVKRKNAETLCNSCRHAVPDKADCGCNWSRYLEPVEGWTVTLTDRSRTNSSVAVGVCVVDCPRFSPEPTTPVRDIDDDGAKAIAAAIVSAAARDYRAACRADAKNMRKWQKKMKLLSKFYGHCDEPKTPAPREWRHGSDHWAKWTAIPLKPMSMQGCENFFKSDYGYQLTECNARRLMNEIRRMEGLAPIEGE